MGLFSKSNKNKVIQKAVKLGASENNIVDAWQGTDGYATHYLVLYPSYLEIYKGGASAIVGGIHGSSEYADLSKLENVGINREGFLRTLSFRGPGFDIQFPSGKKEASEIKQTVLDAKAKLSA